mmetsp:Transcript_17986/g.43267  ORF Transcript_17986/g.43267 Transcript_17986/m.43267 type:complete len:87 (+) Transcript_17986:42-302(+)
MSLVILTVHQHAHTHAPERKSQHITLSHSERLHSQSGEATSGTKSHTTTHHLLCIEMLHSPQTTHTQPNKRTTASADPHSLSHRRE